jgi:hypothetical protein
MPHSPPSTVSSSSDPVSRQQTTKRGRKSTYRFPRTVIQYPHCSPKPSEELEVLFSQLDAIQVTAHALVAADDLIVPIFDDPRSGMRILTVGKGGSRSTHDYREFKRKFEVTFRHKMADPQSTANLFATQMIEHGVLGKDDGATATAFEK